MTEANRKCSFQFSERVKETKVAKKKMTSELDHVMQEVSALEKSILDLEEGIKAKEGSLMVCGKLVLNTGCKVKNLKKIKAVFLISLEIFLRNQNGDETSATKL